jgi:hypothetical protein
MVTGQYTLISCRSDAGHHVDASGFEVKVFYDCSREERKLYASHIQVRQAGGNHPVAQKP